MKCVKCGSERTIPLNAEKTVYECGACNRRFHIHGIQVDQFPATPSSLHLMAGGGILLPPAVLAIHSEDDDDGL